jgi:uncharacterized membrane protein
LIAVLALCVALATGGDPLMSNGRGPLVVLFAGFLGCQLDSVLGAVLENRGLMTKGTVNAASILAGSVAAALLLGFP